MKQHGNAPYGTFVFGRLFYHRNANETVSSRVICKRHEGVQMSFTDPSAYDSELLFSKQIEAAFPLLASEDVDFIFDTLYSQTYDGSQPYTDSLGRAQLLIGEGALIFNENSIVKAVIHQNLAAFGYEYSAWPAVHGANQVPLFSRGPTPGVNPQASRTMKNIVAGFVDNGSPNKSPSGLSAPLYGQDSSIPNILVNASSVNYDPTANKRCDWWQKALYY